MTPNTTKQAEAEKLTKQMLGRAWRDCGALSASPPDWAIQFARNIANELLSASKPAAPQGSGVEHFNYLCSLLPEGFNWSDPLTPDVLSHIVSAAIASAYRKAYMAGWNGEGEAISAPAAPAQSEEAVDQCAVLAAIRGEYLIDPTEEYGDVVYQQAIYDCENAIQKLFAARAASLQSAATQTWQSIETAPKDGTPLVLFARYIHASASVIIVGHYMLANGMWINTTFGDAPIQEVVPSHWMRRPDFPPVAPKKREAK